MAWKGERIALSFSAERLDIAHPAMVVLLHARRRRARPDAIHRPDRSPTVLPYLSVRGDSVGDALHRRVEMY